MNLSTPYCGESKIQHPTCRGVGIPKYAPAPIQNKGCNMSNHPNQWFSQFPKIILTSASMRGALVGRGSWFCPIMVIFIYWEQTLKISNQDRGWKRAFQNMLLFLINKSNSSKPHKRIPVIWGIPTSISLHARFL